MSDDELPFWKSKSLSQMTDSEWESLCDGCGRCCLVKLEDADDYRRTYFTDVGCKLLDGQTCRCTDYAKRSEKVRDCVTLSTRNINRIVWLPPTCGYVLVAKGKDLIAQRIKEIAAEHHIPMVENVPLAQALYKGVPLGREIPAHLYQAVAEVLAFVFRLRYGIGERAAA